MCKCGHRAVWHKMWVGRCEVGNFGRDECGCKKWEAPE